MLVKIKIIIINEKQKQESVISLSQSSLLYIFRIKNAPENNKYHDVTYPCSIETVQNNVVGAVFLFCFVRTLLMAYSAITPPTKKKIYNKILKRKREKIRKNKTMFETVEYMKVAA